MMTFFQVCGGPVGIVIEALTDSEYGKNVWNYFYHWQQGWSQGTVIPCTLSPVEIQWSCWYLAECKTYQDVLLTGIKHGLWPLLTWCISGKGFDAESTPLDHDLVILSCIKTNQLDAVQWMWKLANQRPDMMSWIQCKKSVYFKFCCQFRAWSVFPWWYQTLALTPKDSFEIMYNLCRIGRLSNIQWLFEHGGYSSREISTFIFQTVCFSGHLDIAQWMYPKLSDEQKQRFFDTYDLFANSCLRERGVSPGNIISVLTWWWDMRTQKIISEPFFTEICVCGSLPVFQWLITQRPELVRGCTDQLMSMLSLEKVRWLRRYTQDMCLEWPWKDPYDQPWKRRHLVFTNLHEAVLVQNLFVLKPYFTDVSFGWDWRQLYNKCVTYGSGRVLQWLIKQHEPFNTWWHHYVFRGQTKNKTVFFQQLASLSVCFCRSIPMMKWYIRLVENIAPRYKQALLVQMLIRSSSKRTPLTCYQWLWHHAKLTPRLKWYVYEQMPKHFQWLVPHMISLATTKRHRYILWASAGYVTGKWSDWQVLLSAISPDFCSVQEKRKILFEALVSFPLEKCEQVYRQIWSDHQDMTLLHRMHPVICCKWSEFVYAPLPTVQQYLQLNLVTESVKQKIVEAGFYDACTTGCLDSAYYYFSQMKEPIKYSGELDTTNPGCLDVYRWLKQVNLLQIDENEHYGIIKYYRKTYPD